MYENQREHSETRCIRGLVDDLAVEGPPELGSFVAGRYRLGTLIGRGAVSEVFAARDHWTGRDVAVKVMPPYGRHPAVTRERFSAEMRLSRDVIHPNVVQVLDAGHTKDSRPFIVMEALSGQTLGDCLRRHRNISPGGALRLVRDAARGLAALHKAGVVHRDVKPDNLFLCQGDAQNASVKVIDFGFAAPSGAAEPDPLKVLGTPGYIAPEQAVGETADGRADVYALGVVLFRCLTGELPFDDCSDKSMIAHHLGSRIPPPSWLRDGMLGTMDVLVQSATRKHPDNRYPNMDAFLRDLERAMADDPILGAPLSVEPDVYLPQTELGRRVMAALARAA